MTASTPINLTKKEYRELRPIVYAIAEAIHLSEGRLIPERTALIVIDLLAKAGYEIKAVEK